MAARDDIQEVAAVLTRPRSGYLKRLEQAQRAIDARSGDASNQLGLFVERIADLTLEELRELHDETYRGDVTIGPLVDRLVHEQTGSAEADAALATLAPLLARLESERNPYVCVLRALCCLLLLRVKRSGVHERRH
jgi:nitrate reductase assembly molybdenum cofactor insertion protein NarJ